MSNQRFQIKDPTVIIANAYHFAALQPNIWMSKVTTILEALRKEFTTRSIYDVWVRWQQPEEGGYPVPLLKTLVQLRRDSYNLFLSNLIPQLQAAFKENEEQAWSEFIGQYTEAINNWQTDIAEKLCRNCLDYTHHLSHREYKSKIEALQKLNKLHCASRWVECIPFYSQLVEEPALSNEQKAQLEATIGQIRLYYLDSQPEPALAHFNRALELAPQLARTERSSGEVKLKYRVFDEARQHFFKALEMKDSDSENYLYIGDSYKDDLNLSAAENWYQAGLKINPLDANFNARMARLYGEPSLIHSKQSMFVKELEMVKIIEPDTFYNNSIYNILREIAAAYQLNQKNDEAIHWYNKAIEHNPEWLIAWLDLGYTYFYMNNFDEAEKHFQKTIDMAPECFDGHWGMATLYEQQKKTEEAIAAYDICIQMRPEWEHSIRNTEGVLYYDKGDYEKSIVQYSKAVALQSDIGIYHDNLARAYQSNKQNDKAEVEYLKALELEPNNSNYYNRLGILFYEQKNYTKAIEYYQKAIEILPTDNIYWDNLGLAYSYIPDWEKADEAYQKACELVPQDAVFINSLGVRYYERKQYEKSIEYYQKAILINPIPLYYENIGLSYEVLAKIDLAEESYLKAIELTENAPKITATEKGRTYNCLGVFYDNLKQLDKAISYYQKAVAAMPKTVVYQTNLAGAYENTQNWNAALEIYQNLSKKEPKNDNYHNRLAYNYFQLKDYDAAIKHLKEAVKLSPKMAIYHENIGYFNDTLGNYEEALKAYEKAVELEPNDYRYSAMANICRKMKTPQLAIGYLEKAIALNPKHADYYNDMGVIYFDNAIDDYKSIEYYKKAIELNPESAIYHSNLGLVYETVKDFVKAQECYEKYIALNPATDNSIKHRLGVMNARLGKIKETESIIKTLENNAQKAECLNGLGIYFYTSNQYEESIKYYQKALKIYPLLIYYENIGLAYEGLNNLKKAEETYLKGLELIQSDTQNSIPLSDKARAYNALGVFYNNQKNYSKAHEYYEKALEWMPNFAIYQANIAGVYEAEQQWDKAIEYYEKALINDPKNDIYHNRLVHIYFTLENDVKALNHLMQTIELDPTNLIYRENLGFFHNSRGHFNEALEAYLKVIELDPNRHEVYNIIGKIYKNLKNIPLAIQYLEKSIELDPQNDDYYNGLGVIYFENAIDDNKAIELYKKSIELNPHLPVYFNNLGLVYQTLNDLPNAQSAYLKALELTPEPDDILLYRLGVTYARQGAVEPTDLVVNALTNDSYKAECINHLGIYFYNQKILDKASEYYYKAIQTDPLPVYFENLALVYEDNKEWDAAIEVYNILLGVEPDNTNYHSKLVMSYFQLGDYDKALSHLQKSVELEPNNDIYHENLGFCLKTMGEYEKALAAYLKAIDLAPEKGYRYEFVAAIYQKLNNLPKSQEYLTKALALKPIDSDN